MNMMRILAQISPTLNGNLAAAPTGCTPSPNVGAGRSHRLPGLMEQANAMAGRSPAQARQLRAGALAMLRVVR